MDWWRVECLSSESEKYFQRPKFAGKSLKFCRRSDFHQISGSEVWKLRAWKIVIHPPRHSIPPLGSLLLVFAEFILVMLKVINAWNALYILELFRLFGGLITSLDPVACITGQNRQLLQISFQGNERHNYYKKCLELFGWTKINRRWMVSKDCILYIRIH